MKSKAKKYTKKSIEQQPVILAYKGFDKDLKCRGYQFEVGKTYQSESPPIRCGNSGFHACDNPFDVLEYYSMDGANRFALVEASGEICRQDANDTKFAAASLTIKAELKMPDFFKACADYIWNIVDPAKLKITHTADTVISKKKEDKIGTSGYNTQIGTSGNYTQIGTSGNYTQIGTSGYNTQIGTSGYNTQIGTSGYNTQIGTSGNYTQIGTSGNYTKIGTSGYNTQIGTSGNYTQIGTSGYNTQIGTSGNYTKIGTSGYNTQIELNGEHGVIACVHAAARVKGSLGTLICLVHHADDNKTPIKFVTGQIGKDNLKPDTWYQLDNNGKFKEII